ncbi:MAG TPA: proline dehydrogenase family protein [Thermoflexales bacterium]|nr:proline dehydrogenase family protein [Thermoflexales bacterium]
MPIARDTLLWLSRSKFLRESIIKVAPARAMSRKFVAGEKLSQALDVIASLNAQGIGGILDYLGENTTTAAEAEAYTAEQIAAVQGVIARKLNAYLSLKLTAMGLDIGPELAEANLRKVLDAARAGDIFVRVDMESSEYVERTLAIVIQLWDDGYTNLGTVIQSYLYRSEKDVQDLVVRGTNLRLVKGAYNEPASAAYPDKADVDAQYVKLVKFMLDAPNCFCGIATHDEAMIEAAKTYARQNAIPNSRYEFQMLYGIKTSLLKQLAQEGYATRAYIPYGTHWYPYFMRRLAERPSNVAFVVKGAFG